MPKRKIVIKVPAAPQAYVMPVPPPYDGFMEKRLSTMTEEEWLGMNRPTSLPVIGDGRTSRGDDVSFDDLDLRTDIEKATEPAIWEAIDSDFLEHLSELPAPVDLDNPDLSNESVQVLLIAVWSELKSWRRQPTPEVIAKAVGLAIARTRGERGIKHPRDLAKEVRVRPQTFFKVLNVATAEIERLGLREGLGNSGTYSQDVGDKET